MALVVHKYGGSSLATTERIKVVAECIAECVKNGQQLVVVASAMGQQTNQLLALAQALSDAPPKRELDMLLSTGERVSMALLSIALDQLGVKAISLTGSQSGILTDATHTNARISRVTGERIRQALEKVDVVIVAGFQGVDPVTKEITTLGRGGSDLTAVALAKSLSADRCEIFTDVDGLCTADPKWVANARVMERISWPAAAQLAWGGAKVIHSRAAHLAGKYRIPLRKRSSFNLAHPGTLIEGTPSMESPVVVAVTLKPQMNLVSIASDHPRMYSQILEALWAQGVAPMFERMLWRESHCDIQLMIPIEMNMLCQKLVTTAGWKVESPVWSAISLVGDGFLQSPELLVQVQECVGTDLRWISHSNHAILVAVDPSAEQAVLNKLHQHFIESRPQ